MTFKNVTAAAESPDPGTGLRAVRALQELSKRLEVLQVERARSQGWTWQEIASELGVSTQAVHKKHSRKKPKRG